MKVERLEQLLLEEIRDIYDAEKQLVKALPKMAKSASSEELREAINEHLDVTKGQVERLEQVFEALSAKAQGKSCMGMKGLIEEGREQMELDGSDELRDAAIIGAAQRVEHYEISAYGTARTFAEKLGMNEVAELLQTTMDEEREADERLTEISETLLGDLIANEDTMIESAPARRASAPKVKRSSGH
jgi:ferritin-like metal-binding protein YciE